MALPDDVEAMRRALTTVETTPRAGLMRRYQQAYDAIAADLTALTSRIAAAERAGTAVSADWVRREARYRALLASIDREMAAFADDGVTIVQRGQQRAATVATTGATAQAISAGYAIDVGSARISPTAQTRILDMAHERTLLGQTLNRYPARVREVVERELFTGLAAGRHPRDVERSIRRALTAPVVELRLDTTVRTAMMRAARGAVSDQLAALGVDAKLWCATLSPRTCPACLSRHGRRYPLDAEMDSHARCRCTWTPAPRAVTPALRPFLQSGDAWLRGQPASVQRQVLGADDLVAMFRRGDLALKDFVTTEHDPIWGVTMTAKTPGQVMRAMGRAA